MNAIDLFLIRGAAVGGFAIVFILVGFWMGRKTKGPPSVSLVEKIAQPRRSGSRDKGTNPFTDNLKPIGMRDRIPTMKG